MAGGDSDRVHPQSPPVIRRAVDAIVSQQYEGDIDVIVVFDQTEPDSSIETETGARKVTITSNTRKPGLTSTRNTGIGLATGAYVAFCDDDDEWLPDKLRAQIELLESDPTISTAVCGLEIIYGDRSVVRTLDSDRLTFDDFLLDRIMEAHPSTVVFRRELHDQIGPVDQALPGGYYEDYEWLLRASPGRADRLRQSSARQDPVGRNELLHRQVRDDRAGRQPPARRMARVRLGAEGQGAAARAGRLRPGRSEEASHCGAHRLAVHPARPTATSRLPRAGRRHRGHQRQPAPHAAQPARPGHLTPADRRLPARPAHRRR